MKKNYTNVLFNAVLGKYLKYYSRLNKKIKNGTFASMAASKRNALIKKVERLRFKLESLQSGFAKYAAVASLTVMAGSLNAQSPIPFFRNDAENPFPNAKQGSTSIVTFNGGDYELVAFADLDNDGDLDVVGGNYYDFKYFKNEGNTTSPDFQEQTGTSNPFDGLLVAGYASPNLADLDGDGDLDMISGQDGGTIRYFENTGTASAPAFAEVTGTFSPFYGLDLGDELVPFAVDIDDDGDLDLMVGEEDYSQILYLKNVGDFDTPVFNLETGSNNPFEALAPLTNYRSQPTFVDIDNDGDFDAFVGDEGDGDVEFYKNTGSATTPEFTQITGTDNPLLSFGNGGYTFPSFADIDDDGDLDLFIGGEGSVQYFTNTGTAASPEFGLAILTAGRLVNGFIDAGIVDIDNDGDLDAFVGGSNGQIHYLKNTGTASLPELTIQVSHPLDGITVSYNSSIEFVDLDNDGDMDVVIGASYRNEVKYFLNTGTASAASFSELTGTFNPIPVPASGYVINNEFADIDDDGDLDLLVTTSNSVSSYLNVGTATTPVFSELTGTYNALGILLSGINNPVVAAVDLDDDGDLDLVAGEYYADPHYFENTGTAAVPTYSELTGTANPFYNLFPGTFAKPEFWDFDNDGDLDAFFGVSNGTIVLLENNTTITTSVQNGISMKEVNMEAYPNPTNGSFSVSIPTDLAGQAEVTLLDQKGQVLYKGNQDLQSGDVSFDGLLSEQKSGIYILKIKMENRVAISKVVKY